MKKILSLLAVALLFLTGCNDIPTEAQATAISTSLGYATGIVCELSNVNDKTKTTIVEVVTTVSNLVPTAEQTYVDAWSPKINEVVSKLVEDGKIGEAEGKIVVNASVVFAQGIDYMFNVRWPKIRQYSNLVSATITGFTSGFTTAITPTSKVEGFEYNESEGAKIKEYLSTKISK